MGKSRSMGKRVVAKRVAAKKTPSLKLKFKRRVKNMGVPLIEEKYIIELVPKYRMTFWDALPLPLRYEIGQKIIQSGTHVTVARDNVSFGYGTHSSVTGATIETAGLKDYSVSAGQPSQIIGLVHGPTSSIIPYDDFDVAPRIMACYPEVVQALEYLTKEPIPRIERLNGKKFPNFETVTLPKDLLDSVKEAIITTRKDKFERVFKSWGLGRVLEKGMGVHMLFYGPPGTGKTLLAEAIANELERELKIITSAEIQSSEPGGAERSIKAYFEDAKKNKKVLLFDECDSLIYDRRRIGMILAAEVNCLLGEMERFPGVAVYTTNNTPCLDAAFERRLNLKVCFPVPDKALRRQIWQNFFPVKEALAPCVNFDDLARYVLTGGFIKNIVLAAARRAAHLEREQIQHEDFMFALEREKAGHGAFAERIEDAEQREETAVQSVGGELRKVVAKEADRGNR